MPLEARGNEWLNLILIDSKLVARGKGMLERIPLLMNRLSLTLTTGETDQWKFAVTQLKSQD